ncbi:hypothetical protein B2A_14315 [mine drainage metagenome]|uniref:Transposase IS4 family protein n=1 Tax=mine drainage metagenome TaxID=410659 RepID=T0YA86_9ZZZZ
MVGRVEQQRGFSDILLWLEPGLVRKLEKSFYGALRQFGQELLGGDLFAPMYASGIGRPSVPPILLAKALLLEMHEWGERPGSGGARHVRPALAIRLGSRCGRQGL